MATPEIDAEKCMGCGECVEHCPTHAVALVEGKATIVGPEDCTYCTDCEAFCPQGAIQCPFEIVLKEQESGNASAQL
jgi:MinD superfamily P-loop ATPase